VQFATQDGKPMADAEVSVFAPGDLTHPVKHGRTDKDGKFQFGTDRDGLWTAEARNGTEVARATVKVGGGSSDDQGETSPYVIVAYSVCCCSSRCASAFCAPARVPAVADP